MRAMLTRFVSAFLAVLMPGMGDAAADWIGGTTGFKAGAICLINMDGNDIREVGDYVINDEVWTKFELHLTGIRSSRPRLYILDGPPTSQSLGPGFHDCAEYAKGSKRVLLDADVWYMRGHGFARKPAPGQPFAVDIRELEAEVEKIRGDLSGVFGGTLQLRGAQAKVRNEGRIIGSGDSVTGAVRLTAGERVIKDAHIALESSELVTDLRPVAGSTPHFELDLGSGGVRLVDGRFRSGRISSGAGEASFASFAFRGLSAYSIDALSVQAVNFALTGGAEGVRTKHSSMHVLSQAGMSLGAGEASIARATGAGVAGTSRLVFEKLALADLRATADSFTAAHGSLPGTFTLHLKTWSREVDGALVVSGARSSRMAVFLGGEELAEMRFRLRGEPERMEVQGSTSVRPSVIGPIQLSDVSAEADLPAFTVAGGAFQIPFHVDYALEKGRFSFIDANKEVTLEGHLKRLLLRGVLTLGPADADFKVRLAKGDMVFQLYAAVAVKDLIAGAKPQFAGAELGLENVTDTAFGAAGSSGTLRASASAALLANPVISVGSGKAAHELQGTLESNAAVALDMDLANSTWKVHAASFRAAHISARPLSGELLVIDDLRFEDPRFSLDQVRLDFAEGQGSAELAGLAFSSQKIEHKVTDPSRTGPYWSTSLAEPFSIDRLSARIVTGAQGSAELAKPTLRGLRLAPRHLLFESIDASSRFESAEGAALDIVELSEDVLEATFRLGPGELSARGAASGQIRLGGVEFSLSGSKAAPTGGGLARIQSMDVTFNVPHDPVSVWAVHCPAHDKPRLNAHVRSMTPSQLPFVVDGGGFKGTATLGLTSVDVWLQNAPFSCEWEGAADVDFTVGCLFGECWVEHWSFHYGARFVLHAASLSVISHGATLDIASGAHAESNKRTCLGTFVATTPLSYLPDVSGWLKTDIGGVLGDLIKAAQQLVTGIITGLSNAAALAIANHALLLASITSPVSGKTLCF